MNNWNFFWCSIAADGAVAQKTGDWLRGCIDRTGKWIIPAQFPSIGQISEGMICVGKYVTPRTALLRRWNRRPLFGDFSTRPASR